jgi:NADH:ubiquinone oxidoreductase subunit D
MISKLFATHEKSTRRYTEITDSVEILRQTVDGLEYKAAAIETEAGKLGQEFKSEKELWAHKLRTMTVGSLNCWTTAVMLTL